MFRVGRLSRAGTGGPVTPGTPAGCPAALLVGAAGPILGATGEGGRDAWAVERDAGREEVEHRAAGRAALAVLRPLLVVRR
jgi:hypothetical protein